VLFVRIKQFIDRSVGAYFFGSPCSIRQSYTQTDRQRDIRGQVCDVVCPRVGPNCDVTYRPRTHDRRQIWHSTEMSQTVLPTHWRWHTDIHTHAGVPTIPLLDNTCWQ